MSVYVDDPRWRYGRMLMCHMWADTLEELHRMADCIGLDRRHFQSLSISKWEHYDVSKGYRQRAIDAGAIPSTSRDAVLHRRNKLEDKA